MFSLGRMRCIMCSALLCGFLQYAETYGNNTIPQTDYNCACWDGNVVYNLAPLQRTDGKPRFSVPGSGAWMFSYNPCSSFSLGQPIGNCFGGDVAVCEWVKDESYQNIGNQSRFSCGTDTQYNKPQLEYTNKLFPGWKVIIKLECNPRLKRKEDAKFRVFHHKDRSNPRQFILTHACACPNGCRENPGTTKPTGITTEATVTPAPIKLSKAEKFGLIVGICTAGAIMTIVAVLLVIWIYHRRQMDKNLHLIPSQPDDLNSVNSGKSASGMFAAS